MGRRSASLTALAGVSGLLVLWGCGGGGASSSKPARFPAARGQTLDQLRAGHGPGEIVLAPSGAVFSRGPNRLGFALFDVSHRLVGASSVALYTAGANGQPARGPFVARVESLAVTPRFQSQTVAQDPAAAKVVYVAEIPLPRAGPLLVTGLADVKGRLVKTTEDQLQLSPPATQPPQVGQRAIAIHTPTVAQAGGNLASIDTRVPPAPNLQQLDFARVLGRRPVVLMFATPGLCQSRVCGPVVDIEDQIQSRYGRRAAFIHMEIYKDNKPTAGLRPQVTAWHLPTEPWTFVIDRHGRIAARFEGALSAAELDRAVAGVVAP